MILRVLRLVTVVAAVSALALPAAGVAGPDGRPVDRGVVQAVGPTQIVLTALDSSVLTFSVSRATRVRLNGQRASIADIAPGFVASVYHDGRGRAILIEAFGTPATVTHTGVVLALAPTAITLRTPTGSTLTLTLDRNTRFRVLGAPARRSAVRPGAVVAVVHVGSAPALVVNVLKRPEA